MADSTCTRCEASVPSILGPPPGDQDTWWRNVVRMKRREVTVTHVMRLRLFKRRWLPEHAADQLSETYTELKLCDDCAAAVFMFAQNLPSTRDGLNR